MFITNGGCKCEVSSGLIFNFTFYPPISTKLRNIPRFSVLYHISKKITSSSVIRKCLLLHKEGTMGQGEEVKTRADAQVEIQVPFFVFECMTCQN